MASETDVQYVLYSADQISARCAELGAAIAADYADKSPYLLGVRGGRAAVTAAVG